MEGQALLTAARPRCQDRIRPWQVLGEVTYRQHGEAELDAFDGLESAENVLLSADAPPGLIGWEEAKLGIPSDLASVTSLLSFWPRRKKRRRQIV